MSSPIICTVCNVQIGECSCPDRDKMLREVAYDPKGCVAFKWCRLCDKHYARCRCEIPSFVIMCGGKRIEVPEAGFLNMAGRRVVPYMGLR